MCVSDRILNTNNPTGWLTARILTKVSFFSLLSPAFSSSSWRTRDSSLSLCSMAFFSSSRSLISACGHCCSGLTWSTPAHYSHSLTFYTHSKLALHSHLFPTLLLLGPLGPIQNNSKFLSLILLRYNNSPGSNTTTTFSTVHSSLSFSGKNRAERYNKHPFVVHRYKDSC